MVKPSRLSGRENQWYYEWASLGVKSIA
jgi:hypothetical protein